MDVFLPIVLFVVVMLSIIFLESGRVCSEHTSAFLLVVKTPPCGRRLCTPCCQHLSGWVVGWASADASKVRHFSDYTIVVSAVGTLTFFSDSFACYFFLDYLHDADSEYSLYASVPNRQGVQQLTAHAQQAWRKEIKCGNVVIIHNKVSTGRPSLPEMLTPMR